MCNLKEMDVLLEDKKYQDCVIKKQKNLWNSIMNKKIESVLKKKTQRAGEMAHS